MSVERAPGRLAHRASGHDMHGVPVRLTHGLTVE